MNDGSDIDIKPALLSKRLHKLQDMGYMSKVRHGEWVRLF